MLLTLAEFISLDARTRTDSGRVIRVARTCKRARIDDIRTSLEIVHDLVKKNPVERKVIW